MELLGGVWYRDAPCLEGSVFDELGYHPTHFNDFPSAMVTTWALLMVNNYWVYMDAAYKCTTNRSHWWQVTVYFLAFYFCLVFFLVNLLTSFVLESVLTFFDRADASAAAAAAHAAAAHGEGRGCDGHRPDRRGVALPGWLGHRPRRRAWCRPRYRP